MTRFTDSPYETLMTQKPQYGQEKHTPATKQNPDKAHGKKDHYRELFITPKERSNKT